MADIEKADPRLLLENFKAEERALLMELRELEKKVRLQIAELQAVRQLRKGAEVQVEEAAEEQYEKDHEDLEEQRRREEEEQQNLEELVSDVQIARQEVTDDNNPYQTSAQQAPLYNLPTTEQVGLATDQGTIDELYRLAEKDTHTEEEKQRFFEITSAVVKTRPYEFGQSVQTQADNTYQALKTVLEKKPELAQEYKPASAESTVGQFLNTIKPQTEQQKYDVKKDVL